MSSFPEGFKLEGKFTEKWSRVGNSVPPLFMKAVAEQIRHRFFIEKSAAE
jgi:DNA (cytosine-5)-methyltransferase 1